MTPCPDLVARSANWRWSRQRQGRAPNRRTIQSSQRTVTAMCLALFTMTLRARGSASSGSHFRSCWSMRSPVALAASLAKAPTHPPSPSRLYSGLALSGVAGGIAFMTRASAPRAVARPVPPAALLRARPPCCRALHTPRSFDAGRVRSSVYLAGLYQLSRPSCSFLAAASGVSVPLMTLADSIQVSFSRFGVPRDRIW